MLLGLAWLVLEILVGFIILGILYYIVKQFPIPAEFQWAVRAIFGLLALILLIAIISGGFGGGFGYLGGEHVGLLGR